MLTFWQSMFIVAGTIALSFAFLFLLEWFWPGSQRTEHNDIIGWQISVLGTTYAVILAFMLWNVWSNFQTARINADAEANNLVNLYRIAGGLPSGESAALRSLCREYAAVMLSDEWPAMSHEQASPKLFDVAGRMWSTLLDSRPGGTAQGHGAAETDGFEQIKMQQAFEVLTQLSEQRRLRQIESRLKLPAILWGVLVVGCVVVIGSACLFGCRNLALHFIHVFVLSLLLSLVLVSIAEIDRPFQGPVHVNPDAFQMALQTFDQLGK